MNAAKKRDSKIYKFCHPSPTAKDGGMDGRVIRGKAP